MWPEARRRQVEHSNCVLNEEDITAITKGIDIDIAEVSFVQCRAYWATRSVHWMAVKKMQVDACSPEFLTHFP